MHIRTKIKDLTIDQFEALDQILKTSYEFPEGTTRVCAVFELTELHERHAEMPPAELAQAIYLLDLVERGATLHAHGDRVCAVQATPAIRPL